jgi:hypothetical protein
MEGGKKMKRREFFGKSSCGICGMVLAYFGLTSCAREEEPPAEMTAAKKKPVAQAPEEAMTQKEKIKQMLIDKQGKTEEEAEAVIAEFEEKLPMIQEKCICKDCPTYAAEETENGFCHALVGKSGVIKEEKGCNCRQCPIYQEMGLKNGYYCTRGSEMEMNMV